MAVVIAIQLALQSAFFPFSALSDRSRLNYIDAPFHQYQIHLAAELCEEGQWTGYDPRFGAGHVGGIPFNASAKLPAFIHCLGLGGTDAQSIYKHVSFWGGVVAPSLILLACWILALPIETAVLATLLALFSWWTGAMRWYHTAGMTAFVLASYAAIPFVAAVITVARLQRPAVIPLAAVALGGAFCLLVHPLFLVGACLLGSIWALLAFIEADRKTLVVACIAVVALAVVAVNLFWIVPMLQSPGLANIETPYQRAVEPWLIFKEMSGTAPTAAGGNRLGMALLPLAVASIFLCRGRERQIAIGLVAGAILSMTWASIGSLVPAIAKTQPNRFSAFSWVILSIPAALGMAALARHWKTSRGMGRMAAGVVIAGGALTLCFFVRETWREALAPAGSPRFGVQPPEVAGQGPIEAKIVEFLRTRTDPNARVLFENSLGRVHDGGHVAGLIALQARRELIGGPYPFTLRVNAWDDYLMGHRPDTTRRLEALLDGYNIQWMLCHSAGCKQAMERLGSSRKVAELGPVTAYQRDLVASYFFNGAGQVQDRCGNRVEFTGVAGSRVVLKYLWVPGLRAVPSGQARPIDMIDGEPSFVEVLDPPAAFSLRTGEGDGVPCARRRTAIE